MVVIYRKVTKFAHEIQENDLIEMAGLVAVVDSVWDGVFGEMRIRGYIGERDFTNRECFEVTIQRSKLITVLK